MKWSELKKGWDSDMRNNQERVIDAVRAGHYVQPEFRSVHIKHPKDPLLTASVQMMSDALHLGEPGDSVRVTVSHRTAQAIADLLDLRMPTQWLADRNDDAAVERRDPQVWLKTEGATSDVRTMELDSDAITEVCGKSCTWISGPWKIWINSPRLMQPQAELFGKNTAINYGGWSKLAPSASTGKRNVYQSPGGRHPIDHVDESQKFWAVDDLVLITWGKEGEDITDLMSLDQVAQHPDLWPLVSHTGPILMRHPWIPPCVSLEEGGSCPGGFSGGGGGGSVPTAGTSRGKRLAAAGGVIAGAAALAYGASRWLKL